MTKNDPPFTRRPYHGVHFPQKLDKITSLQSLKNCIMSEKFPKNAICFWLRLRNINKVESLSFNSDFCPIFVVLVGEKFHFFELQSEEFFFSKVSIHEKSVIRSSVRFLFLFVLKDAILLKVDLQKRTNHLDNPANEKLLD